MLDEALARARRGDGPTFLECVTFRFRGHYFGDRTPYIPSEQLQAAIAADPVPRFRRLLIDTGVCTDDELNRIDEGALIAVEAALKTVMGAEAPSIEELDRDVYATPIATPSEEPHMDETDELEMTMREALNLALDQALAADDRVFLLGEDIADPGASGPTAGLSTKYGHDRVLDTPISEAAIVGAAIGAAIDGLLPVAEIMIMDFIGIAADQLINNAAKLRFMTAGRTTAPITVRTAGLRRARHGCDAFAVARGLVHAHPRDEGHRAVHPARRQGPADVGDLRRGPVPVRRDDPAAGPEGPGANRSRILDPARPRRRQAAR